MAINLLYKILLVVFAYSFGSFPTAFIIYKASKGGDIRNYGSGNVGGTNVLRSAGPGLGILTIVVDILKGFIPVLLIYLFFPASYILYIITTVSVLIGHVFPVFLKFKGGKGVSTVGGMIIASCVLPFSGANLILRLLPAVIIVLTVLVIFFLTRVMSIGSITAAVINPIMFYVCKYDNYIIIAAAIWSVIVLVAHRENIKRLFKGEEKKILRKEKEE
ncbi:glycerol-3-phosphate 1-O-acyltransferase PlsY [bacterium]|nr:glycerol-3-phosphate 1-O-acyltransferase PlsY [bacterium]